MAQLVVIREGISQRPEQCRAHLLYKHFHQLNGGGDHHNKADQLQESGVDGSPPAKHGWQSAHRADEHHEGHRAAHFGSGFHFAGNPRKGQMPRKYANTKLLIRLALMNMYHSDSSFMSLPSLFCGIKNEQPDGKREKPSAGRIMTIHSWKLSGKTERRKRLPLPINSDRAQAEQGEGEPNPMPRASKTDLPRVFWKRRLPPGSVSGSSPR